MRLNTFHCKEKRQKNHFNFSMNELRWASITINILIVASGVIVFFNKDENGTFGEVLKAGISGYIGFLGRGIIEKVKADKD